METESSLLCSQEPLVPTLIKVHPVPHLTLFL